MGQTVNLLVFTFGGSNPSLPTIKKECRLECKVRRTTNRVDAAVAVATFVVERGLLKKAVSWVV